jgi:cytoskeleton protein RodZ
MAAISETLRQARLRSGFDLDRLAAKTKINPRYLEAIETGNFDKLPSGIFARMFIKQYADAVGLDGASFAEEFQRNSQFGSYSPPEMGAIVDARRNFHPTVPGMFATGGKGRDERLTSALSSLIWVVAAVLVCAGAYYLLIHLPPRRASTAGTGTAQPSTTPPATAPAPSAEQPPAAPAPAKPDTVATNPPTANPEGSSPTPSNAPPTATPIHLTLTATEPVWVDATADGKSVLATVMKPGEPKDIQAEKGVRVKLGNAGGMEITFNGKKLEPVGPRGQVRTVDFTPWGAQVVPPPQPAGTNMNPDPLR